MMEYRNHNRQIQIVGRYLSKAEYLAKLNAKLERNYQRGIARASREAWRGQLTYFNL